MSEEPGEESWTRAGDKAELLAQASPDTHHRGRLLTTFLAVLLCVAQSVAVVAQASGFGEWRYGPIVAAEMIAKTETVYKVRTPMPSGGPWLLDERSKGMGWG